MKACVAKSRLIVICGETGHAAVIHGNMYGMFVSWYALMDVRFCMLSYYRTRVSNQSKIFCLPDYQNTIAPNRRLLNCRIIEYRIEASKYRTFEYGH
jgi:hypothetical protein